MDNDSMTAALAFELNKDGWKATAYWNEIDFINENDEKFKLTVEKIEEDN